jgi:hypothetical protein
MLPVQNFRAELCDALILQAEILLVADPLISREHVQRPQVRLIGV